MARGGGHPKVLADEGLAAFGGFQIGNYLFDARPEGGQAYVIRGRGDVQA